MKLSFIRRSVLGSVLMLSAASLASADSIIYESPIFGGAQKSIDLDAAGGPYFPANVSLNKFNPSQGELTSIRLFFTYTFNGEVTVLNFSTTPQHITHATSTVPMTVTALVGLGAGNPSASATAVASVGSSTVNTPAVSYQGPNGVEVAGQTGQAVPKRTGKNDFGYVTYKGLTSAGGAQTTSTLAALLAAFTGNGTFNAELTLPALPEGSSFTGGGVDPRAALFFGGSAEIGGKIGIEYTYTPRHTPEPMTMMMVGSAVLGLALVMRKRDKANA